MQVTLAMPLTCGYVPNPTIGAGVRASPDSQDCPKWLLDDEPFVVIMSNEPFISFIGQVRTLASRFAWAPPHETSPDVGFRLRERYSSVGAAPTNVISRHIRNIKPLRK